MSIMNLLSNVPNIGSTPLNPGFHGGNPLLGNGQIVDGTSIFPGAKTINPPQPQIDLNSAFTLLSHLDTESPLSKIIIEAILGTFGLKQPEKKENEQNNAAQQRQPQRAHRKRRSSGASESSGTSGSSSSDEASSSDRAEKSSSKTESTKTESIDKTEKTNKTESTDKTAKTTDTESKVVNSKLTEKTDAPLTETERASLDKDLTKEGITKKEYDQKFDEKIEKAKTEADELFESEWPKDENVVSKTVITIGGANEGSVTSEVNESKGSENDIKIVERRDYLGNLIDRTKIYKMDDGKILEKRIGGEKYIPTMKEKRVKNEDGETTYSEITSDRKKGMGGVFYDKGTVNKITKYQVLSDDGKNYYTTHRNDHEDGSYETYRTHGIKRGVLCNDGVQAKYLTWSKTMIDENGEKKTANPTQRNSFSTLLDFLKDNFSKVLDRKSDQVYVLHS